MSIIELILSLAAILGAAVIFTNAVEILGDRLGLGHGAVGSILAAVGTALPETMIPIVAILGAVIVGSGGAAAGEIGIGAILGAPFLLATLALFIVGLATIGYKGRRGSGSEIVVNRQVTIPDMAFFLVCFTLAAGAGLISLPLVLKIGLAVFLILAYVAYVIRTIRTGDDSTEGEPPDSLTLWPFRSAAPTWAVTAQVVGSVAVMGFGAHIFVDAVGHISTAIGIPAGLIALVLAPLATELPEKFNSVIWLRDNKDTLALGNITGAMVFQSTIPVSVGILFTPWDLGFLSMLSAVFALVSGFVFIGFLLRKGPIHGFYLLGAGSLYLVFLVAAVVTVVGA
ncbi:MAG: Sodium/calcium exchanger membrane region [uncultured Rubrobacteraceae bacterium]|uniref:Sodium/calcium exchanger membrane region n=1 Tax=uncultured Rubrobacteraceae bacterium TaxID=349277 RepID=A0A6J4PQU7_9ACTN|nr:MAG: Sodium/calcium exchanger membrane region [uncultured Rubrobacteraceae bacterium]